MALKIVQIEFVCRLESDSVAVSKELSKELACSSRSTAVFMPS